MSDHRAWGRLFEGALVGGAAHVRTKADVDELVARARMLADGAAAALEHFDGAELPEDEEPGPTVFDGFAAEVQAAAREGAWR